MKGINIWKAVLLLPFLLVLFASPALANKIDQCKTDKDVERFIRSQNDKFNDFIVASLNVLYKDSAYRRIANSFGVRPWQKVDFDRNGRTDLLVYCSFGGTNYLIAFLDEGQKFHWHLLAQDYIPHYFSFPVLVNIGHQIGLITYRTCEACQDPERKKMKTDTLIYKLGGFMEYNSNPTPYQIAKIIYSTTYCYGSCPVFDLIINSDRTVTYNAIKYNDTIGKFKTIVDTANFNSIISILNYINFPGLKEKYAVSWTDDQTCKLTIAYNNGQIKKISDYGLNGTYGLNLLYRKLFALRKNQDWK